MSKPVNINFRVDADLKKACKKTYLFELENIEKIKHQVWIYGIQGW